MQQIEAVIQPFKLSEVRDALEGMGIQDYMESPILCHSGNNRQTMSFRGATFLANTVEKIKVDIITADEAVAKVVETIGAIVKTGNSDDCRITVRPYQLVI